MEKLHYKNNSAFSLVEMLAVLFIVSIIIIILSMISLSDYSKYKDRLAVNEMVSDIYYVQTNSLHDKNSYIDFFSNSGEYVIHTENKNISKKLSQEGKALLNGAYIRLRYRKGNLVSKANTIDVKMQRSSYRVIVHLDSGFVTVDEI